MASVYHEITNDRLATLERQNQDAYLAWMLREVYGQNLVDVAQAVGVKWPDKKEDLGYLLRFAWYHLYWKHHGREVDNDYRLIITRKVNEL